MRASKLVELAGLSPDQELEPTVSNAKLTLSDKAGRVTSEQALDTTVSYEFRLDGLPVIVGQGAKLRRRHRADGRRVAVRAGQRHRTRRRHQHR